MAIRLLVVDDNDWVREELRYAFCNTEVDIIAEATTGEAAVRFATEQDIDVVLMDIKIPCGNGIDALSQIKSLKTNLPILIYSAHDRPDYLQRCALLGANGYLRKGVDKPTLVATVRDAFAGKSVWDQAKVTTNVE
jgi:DNA-binding NarL/FixJ family response regulator